MVPGAALGGEFFNRGVEKIAEECDQCRAKARFDFKFHASWGANRHRADVPEPSALALACFTCLGLAVNNSRRSHRADARCH